MVSLCLSSTRPCCFQDIFKETAVKYFKSHSAQIRLLILLTYFRRVWSISTQSYLILDVLFMGSQILWLKPNLVLNASNLSIQGAVAGWPWLWQWDYCQSSVFLTIWNVCDWKPTPINVQFDQLELKNPEWEISTPKVNTLVWFWAHHAVPASSVQPMTLFICPLSLRIRPEVPPSPPPIHFKNTA